MSTRWFVIAEHAGGRIEDFELPPDSSITEACEFAEVWLQLQPELTAIILYGTEDDDVTDAWILRRR